MTEMLCSLAETQAASVADVMAKRVKIPIIYDERPTPSNVFASLTRKLVDAFWHRRATVIVNDMYADPFYPKNTATSLVGLEFWTKSHHCRVIMQDENGSYAAIPLIDHVIRVP